MIVKVEICIQKATSGYKIVTVLESELESYEAWSVWWYASSMHVCMRVSETSVAWNPLITSSRFGTMILGRSFLKKYWWGQNLEEHSALPKNGHSGSKIVGFLKKNYLVFSLNNLKWNIVIYISLQSSYLSKSWFLSYVSKCFCNISRKKWETK